MFGHVLRLARVGRQVEQAHLAGRARGTRPRAGRRRVTPDGRLVPHGQHVADVETGAAADVGVRQRVEQLGERTAGRAVQHRGGVVRRPGPGRPEEPVQRAVGRGAWKTL